MHNLEIFLFAVIIGCGSIPFVLSQAEEVKIVRDLQDEYAEKNPFGTISTRIIGGDEAVDCEYPYQILLVCYQRSEPQFLCGGSIIAKNWALTAGHCYLEDTLLGGPISYLIEAGSVRRDNPRQSFFVPNENAFRHPLYNETTLENDITLIKTPDFDFSSCHIGCIDIVSDNWTPAFYNDKVMTVSGFGLTSNDGSVSDYLKWTKLTVITRQECLRNFRAPPITCYCAVDPIQPISSVCSGDSGGPAVMMVNNKLVQIGIVSFGSSRGCDTAPQGFVNLAVYHCWIYEMMRNKGLELFCNEMYYFRIFLSVTVIGCGSITSVSSQRVTTVRDLQNDYGDKYPFGTITSRIIGGNNAEDCQIPYQIRLICYAGDVRQFRCGGSIIAKNWVLTAGHCYKADEVLLDPINYVIEAGSVISGQPRQSYTVTNENAFLHPMYNLTTFLENDIALLKMPSDFDFTTCHVNSIKIVSYNWTPAFYVGKRMTVSGFGYTSNTGPVAEHLQFTILTAITKKMCDRSYTEALPLSSFCVQDPDPDQPISSICSGDSGGPAVMIVNNKLVQIGIVSYGSDNGCDTAPQGFVNVALFHCWIYETMQMHGVSF
ncbi:transmembrane protease serine 9-like [Phlebotomus papatasi]|uniref:transmembrane protease serine 9-like n=1 Tax=Phlebotomus papatasi TaxID=29031 RepID=UPI002483CE3C|nr:transmembrane protease serine 9-like [Phlebotomus papatasi]